MSNTGEDGSGVTTGAAEAADRDDGLPRSIDAIVVGSGFGGAITACRLAQAGLRVVVLERGRRYEKGDFPSLPIDENLLPDLKRWLWGSDQGLWDLVDLGEIVSVQAAGYGGGSLVYGNVHLRPPPDVFDSRWPARFREGTALQPFFDLAASMLDVSPVSAHPAFARDLVKADQLLRAARSLGREPAFFYPPLAITHRNGPNAHGVDQTACNACGACCSGCSHGAKNTLDHNYLAIAERRGARVFTQCEVVGLRQRSSREWLVDCFDHLRAERLRLLAPAVFLCAGSIHSTRLLARAGLARSARRVKGLVGVGYFPGGDAIGVAFETAHPQHPSHGPAITTSLVHWNDGDPSSFFLLQDGGYAREIARLVGTLRGPAWVDRNRLTFAGPARVEATGRTPRPSPRPPAGWPVYGSIIDDVSTAALGGAFDGVVSPAVRHAFAAAVSRAKYPLLLPEIVDRTVETAIRGTMEGLRLSLRPDGGVMRAAVGVGRVLVRTGFGTTDSIAQRALRAVLSASGLSPASWAARVWGYSDAHADRRAMFLAMGRDAAMGVLHYDCRADRMVADLDLFGLAPGYAREETLMADFAGALGGELRTNPAWAFLGKPITVHNQGGCRMSDDPNFGVTRDDGSVWGCDGLYVLDGSILCAPVGVNPSATIAALAEHGALQFIRRTRPSWEGSDTEGAREYRTQRRAAERWAARAQAERWAIQPPAAHSVPAVAIEHKPVGLAFDEEMDGYYATTEALPEGDDEYRRLETRGRPAYPVRVVLTVTAENLAAFFEDPRHRMTLTGTASLRLPGRSTADTFPIESGSLQLLVSRFKPHAIPGTAHRRRTAQEAVSGREYTTLRGDPPAKPERFMNYRLDFRDGARRLAIAGYKRLKEDPSLEAWRDASSLFVRVLSSADGSNADPHRLVGAGVIHVELGRFVFEQIRSMRALHTEDPSRISWALTSFATFFFGTLVRVAAPGAATALETLFLSPHRRAEAATRRAGVR